MNFDISWFEKYRAKSLDEYIFPNKEIENFAKTSYENEKISGNTLFYGKPGTGKSNLAQILIKKIIKNKNDLFVIKERSVKEIDQIKIWIQKPPTKSKQKIVFCEEADRLLQSKQAIAELKTITEKYMTHTIFFFITNYISKFISTDKALVTRFTYKFEFNTLPVDKVFERLKFILDNENIRYNQENLKQFVEDNIHLGLRDLINQLQILSLSGEFKYDKTNGYIVTNDEDEIVKDILEFIGALLSTPKEYVKQLNNITNILLIDHLAKPYTKISTKIQNDTLLDYQYIISKILDNLTFLPFYKVTLDYLENIERKKYKNLHLLSLLYEYIKILSEMTL